jgi:hypothetical protein
MSRKATDSTVTNWPTTPNALTVTSYSGPVASPSLLGRACASRWMLAVMW